MNNAKIRVGIIGLRPDQGWAAVAHLPALRHLSGSFVIAGVANSTLESALAAANAHQISQAFASVADLVSAPDIDLVVVTTRVPQHYEVVRAAISARKHVYCEWPLGRTPTEAAELADLARSRGILAVTGTQSRVSPPIRQLQRLVVDGYVGQIVSTCITGYVKTWGPTIADVAGEQYLRERSNGATLLTIPLGHTLAAVRDVLGDIADVSSVLETRFPQVRVTDSDTFIPADAPDHIVVAGRLSTGAPLAMFYAGGTPPGEDGFAWDIRGTDGDLRVTGPHGYTQIAQLKIRGRRGDSDHLQEISQAHDPLQGIGLVAGNVARIYQRIADDMRNGTRTAPTFDQAVELHRALWAIEQSAENGVRTRVDSGKSSLRSRQGN